MGYDNSDSNLTQKEITLLDTDYTVPVSDDSIEELTFLIDSYFKIKDISTDIEVEAEARKYCMEVIRAILLEYVIPKEDLLYLFRFALTVDHLRADNSNDKLFTEEHSRKGTKTLALRLDEYIDQKAGLFRNSQIYESIFEIEPPLNKCDLYKKVLNTYYQDLVSLGTVDSFSFLLSLYNENKPLSDKYLETAPLPSDTLDEFKAVVNMIANNPKQKSSLTKRYADIKKIVSEKYPDDGELSTFVKQGTKHKKATTFNRIKWGTLIVSLILIPFYIGIIMIIAWGILFFTPIGDNIPFIKEGRRGKNNHGND